ncbi:sperm-associated antigen 8-like [Pecten maximus]|uniref:sperm-associated antigen 8-like n=1 Tax=Pecten maximus TaxID=6579 RepID=UPI001458E0EC|nr:sperm-associated antigen 8-like [Pecten maximus]
MSILNEGRNEIRFNNSNSQCLIENWVEERAVKQFDEVEDDTNITSSAQKFRDGHLGVLTTDFDANAEKLTTVRASYKRPEPCGVRLVGKKEELMKQMLLEKVSQEVFRDDINPPEPETTDFRSVTMKDFNKEEFKHVKPAPTRPHDYRKDQPVSFWSEHKDRITGVSQVKTRDTPFRKNDAFSKPIDEYWDETGPYELENYPKM